MKKANVTKSGTAKYTKQPEDSSGKPRDEPATDPVKKPEADPCVKETSCSIDICIKSSGTINIYNCTAPCEPKRDQSENCCPALPDGVCLPIAPGRKHKLSREQRLSKRALGRPVPSALAASAIHTIRRFLLGKQPANALESASYAVLSRLTPQMRDVMSCAVSSFDDLPKAQRDTLFDRSLALGEDQPIDGGALSAAVAQEIIRRTGLLAFGDPEGPEQERPGRVRVYEPSGEDFFSQVRICRINDLRTANFIPALSPGDLLPDEVQHDCSSQIVNGNVQVVCEVRSQDCPGHRFNDQLCMRVLDIEAGDAVVLRGVNYFSVDAKVRLTSRPPATVVREVDAHVFGDIVTPVTETVNGATALVNDCRVDDRITFRLPDDLPPAIYEIQVVVPNITGIAALGNALVSNVEFINVLPASTARFQITAERLGCRKESSPAWAGSDEVGLNFLTLALFADMTMSDAVTNKFPVFGDVDSGEHRNLNRLLFDQQQPIAAVVVTTLGHEVDGQDAYENMITDWKDIFVDLVEKQWNFVKAGLAAAGGASLLGKLGPYGWIAIGIGAVVTAGIDLIIALWAPADLIIEDSLGYSTADLTALTSANFPPPADVSYVTPGQITVNPQLVEKIPLQYRVRHDYVDEDEDARYDVTYRVNRVA